MARLKDDPLWREARRGEILALTGWPMERKYIPRAIGVIHHMAYSIIDEMEKNGELVMDRNYRYWLGKNKNVPKHQ